MQEIILGASAITHGYIWRVSRFLIFTHGYIWRVSRFLIFTHGYIWRVSRFVIFTHVYIWRVSRFVIFSPCFCHWYFVSGLSLNNNIFDSSVVVSYTCWFICVRILHVLIQLCSYPTRVDSAIVTNWKKQSTDIECMRFSGADPGNQVRGGALKKIAPSGGRCENLWGISCEKSKKSYFFQF